VTAFDLATAAKMFREDSPVGSDDEIYVNAQDGLNFSAMDEENRIRRQLEELGVNLTRIEGQLSNMTLEDLVNSDPEQFPTSLIITGFNEDFFDNNFLKQQLESIFHFYGQDAQLYYFKSFKRVRVTYDSAASAIKARIKVHMSTLGTSTLKCYFGQPLVKSKSSEDGLLHPPVPDKLFLISPPASPPVDWAPIKEHHPNLDFELVTALAKLGPGGCHELHKPESVDHPSIVVHIADDEESMEGLSPVTPVDGAKPKYLPTKRPD